MMTKPCGLGMVLVQIWLIGAAVCPAEERGAEVFRTFMPDAGPSAFAVTLGPHLALCYDSLRGGVNQVWHGSVDLAPTLRAKINQPAGINGAVFYRESTLQPLRVHQAKEAPERRFKGYRYERDGVTFQFTLDSVAIEETLKATEDGRGLERIWQAPAGVALFFVADPQKGALVSFRGGSEVSPGLWRFTASADAPTFVMTVKRS